MNLYEIEFIFRININNISFWRKCFAASKRPITLEQAQKIALKRINGGDVEKHNKPVYSFFIKESDGVMTHILVNEKGKIVRFVDETPETAKIK